MLDNIMNLLFGCRHRQITRPITAVHRPNTEAGETYVACLECGRRFHYDVNEMRIGTPMAMAAAQGPASFEPFQGQY